MLLDLCPHCAAPRPAHGVVCEFDGEVLVPADADPLLGQQVGAWRVVRRLGIGGMGAVYEALDEAIGKRLALKVLHPHLLKDPRLPSLLAEARAVNAIGDEGIVNVFSSGTLPDGRPYLAMELLEGELLEALLARKKRLELAEAIDLLVPVLQALEAAHGAGFVHRDLKPANVFIAQRPNRPPAPKLLDFGIANRIKDGADDAMGTPAYTPPEQAANLDVGAKADLYAFGCMLFEVLTGAPPFGEGTTRELMKKHRSAPRPSVKAARADVPDALDDLVRALMAVQPTERPASAAAVRAVLLDVKRALETPPPAPPSRAPLGLGVAGLVVVLAVVGFFALRPAAVVTPPPPPEDPVALAATAAARDVEQKLATPDAALAALLAAESSFPGRAEWTALRGKLSAALRLDARGALDRGDAELADEKLATLGKLGPLSKDDALVLEAQRLSFAQHAGMVRVGAVFIDRYEHPNRAGAQPTTEVDWEDAVKLCEQAGKHLCSEAEWERACRGAAGLAWPWGATFEKQRCAVKAPKTKRAAASGAHPKCAGPEGVFDLVGNVAEWTSTPIKEGAPQRVTRGGSFAQGDAKLACDARDYFLPGQGGAKHLGFRCCL